MYRIVLTYHHVLCVLWSLCLSGFYICSLCFSFYPEHTEWSCFTTRQIVVFFLIFDNVYRTTFCVQLNFVCYKNENRLSLKYNTYNFRKTQLFLTNNNIVFKIHGFIHTSNIIISNNYKLLQFREDYFVQWVFVEVVPYLKAPRKAIKLEQTWKIKLI